MPTNGNEKNVKVLILGSGPAGLAAALYAARAELAPVVLTGMQLGGQAALTHTIENYPGFPTGVGGPELGELFQKQAENFGAKVEFDMAHSVDLSQRPFKVTTDSGEYKADTLILSTGANPTHLNVPGEVELTGRGVSYCATCDGWFFKDKKVVIVGGGDSAVEEGLLYYPLCFIRYFDPSPRRIACQSRFAEACQRTSQNELHLGHRCDRGRRHR